MMYDVTEDISGETFASLVAYAEQRCPYFSFVIRDSLRLSQKGLRVLNSLTESLLKTEETDHWPGTQLHGGRLAVVNTYRLTPETRSTLVSATTSLYGWRQPDLPEDLCFWKDDSQPWLVTISHEQDAYFETSKQEIHKLVTAIPALQKAIVATN